jgi:hypothetical protein
MAVGSRRFKLLALTGLLLLVRFGRFRKFGLLRTNQRLLRIATFVSAALDKLPAFGVDAASINSSLSCRHERPLIEQVDQHKQDCPAARSLQDCCRTKKEENLYAYPHKHCRRIDDLRDLRPRVGSE